MPFPFLFSWALLQAFVHDPARKASKAALAGGKICHLAARS